MKRYRNFQGMSWFLIAFDVLLILGFILPVGEHLVLDEAGIEEFWELGYLWEDEITFIGYVFFVLLSILFQLLPIGSLLRQVCVVVCMVIASLVSLGGLLASSLIAQDFSPWLGTYLSCLFAPLLFIHLLMVEFKGKF